MDPPGKQTLRLTTREIPNVAREILAQAAGGIRWMELLRAVQEKAPDTPMGTIAATLSGWAARTDEIAKPSRGVWVLKKNLDALEPPVGVVSAGVVGSVPEAPSDEPGATQGKAEVPVRGPDEASLYRPFADWLASEDEATAARPLGGSAMKAKWGTPDVVGTTKSRASDPLRFPLEIIAAEIKADATASIVAFGQACAYRLFAHRSCVVMPASMAEYDRDRLLTLCGLYGIGMVLWTREADGFRFGFETRPRSHQPDAYYANEFAKRIRDQDPDAFNALF